MPAREAPPREGVLAGFYRSIARRALPDWFTSLARSLSGQGFDLP